MAGLQRSSGTFRRSGSSGMVWDDDRHLSGELARPSPARRGTAADDHGRRLSGEIARPSPARVQRSRSTGHRASAGRVSPALDPPSPRVGVCSFCGFFSDKTKKKKKGGGAKAGPKKIAPKAGQAAAGGSPRRRRASG